MNFIIGTNEALGQVSLEQNGTTVIVRLNNLPAAQFAGSELIVWPVTLADSGLTVRQEG